MRNLLLLSALFDTTVDELTQGDVAAMEQQCKHDRAVMGRIGTGMAVAAILGIVAALVGLRELYLGWGAHAVPTFILAAVHYGAALGLAFWRERIKKTHDLVTYREIVDFWEGRPVVRDNERSTSARRHRALKAAAGILAGALVGAAAGALLEMAFPLG